MKVPLPSPSIARGAAGRIFVLACVACKPQAAKASRAMVAIRQRGKQRNAGIVLRIQILPRLCAKNLELLLSLKPQKLDMDVESASVPNASGNRPILSSKKSTTRALEKGRDRAQA